jgi:hypothetical protein
VSGHPDEVKRVVRDWLEDTFREKRGIPSTQPPQIPEDYVELAKFVGLIGP